MTAVIGSDCAPESFILTNVLLNADVTGTTAASAKSPQVMPRSKPSSTTNHKHTSPPSTPSDCRQVGQTPSIGIETMIVKSGTAATTTPKKLWP